MEYNKLIIESLESGKTKKIILNRAEKRNSLDEEMISELTDAMKNFSGDNETHSILITGAGGNFCSGLFLDYLQKISEYDIIQNREDSKKFKELLLSIYNCRKPVIAIVERYALAGGCGIASACDLVYASDNAQFGYTEVKIGFIPAIVMIFLMKKIKESHAKDLLLSSRFIDANEAFEIGLVNKVFPQDELELKVREVYQNINSLPLSSLMLTKEMFRNVSSMSLESALDYAVDLNAITRMTDECKKGVSNFLNKTKK
jgi:methylglutaconyl-CoA hydratase